MKHPILASTLAATLSIGSAFAAEPSKSKSQSEAVNPQPLTYANVVSSLTQFNRTFKRVFGQSPSDFRARLSSRKRTGKAA